MADKVKIGNLWVGKGEPCFVVAEIGINHNGDLDIAHKLIEAAHLAGVNAVKFQKRTIEELYTAEEFGEPKESPFGTTFGEYKKGVEFGFKEYRIVDEYCRMSNLIWFASCWDKASVDVIEKFNPPCYKIASACLTDDDLLRHHRKYKRPIILSTGMSTLEQIDHAVEVLGKDDLILTHCVSTYPAKIEELNLRVIHALQQRYNVPVGYSGHDVGLATTVASVAMGACIVERHITLDRAMWGTDQAASVEPHGFSRLIRDIRAVEVALGDGQKRVYEDELLIIKKLRRK